MKQVEKTLLIAPLFAASLCAAWCKDGLADSSLLLVTSDFPPYVFCEKDATTGIELARKGIDIDLLSELFQRIGQPYSIQCLSRKRAVEKIKGGEAAGVFPGFKTPERESFALFLDDPLQLSQYSLFVKQGSEFPFATLDDLAGKRIGIERGHNVSLDFHAAASAGKYQVEEASAPEQNLKKLLAGRIDAYINNCNVVRHMAKQLGMLERIAILPNPVTQGKPSYFMISKAATIPDKPQLIQRLNQALHEMWQDGTVERITRRYNN
jgi:polar amino acid transport system substrate-binding protein